MKDNNGDTALLWSVINNNLEASKYLIINGANINCINKINKTPLLYAIDKYTYDHNPEIIKYLLQYGATIYHNFKTWENQFEKYPEIYELIFDFKYLNGVHKIECDIDFIYKKNDFEY